MLIKQQTGSILDESGTPLSLFMVEKSFRLLHRIRSRINALMWQHDAQSRSNSSIYSVPVQTAFQKDMEGLKNILKKLDNNNVISPSCLNTTLIATAIYKEGYEAFNQYPKTIEEHSKLLFNGYIARKKHREDTALEARVKEMLRDKSKKARKAEMESLLWLEALEREKQGWYFIFNTLTVAPEYLSDVFNAGSSVWTDYVRRVDRLVGISRYGSWQKAKDKRSDGQEFHTYLAVIERGGKNGALHIHVLHMMEKLPENWTDPNTGMDSPYKREIGCAKQLWSYGFSTPIAVRFNNSDAFAQDMWRMPCIKNGEGKTESIKCGSVEQVIGYISKYIGKQMEEIINPQEVLKWRVRKSRCLGKTMLCQITSQLTLPELQLIMLAPAPLLKFREKILPVLTLRHLATRQFIRRSPSLSSWKYVRGLMPRESMLSRINNMIQKIWPLRCQSYGDIRLLDLVRTEGSRVRAVIKQVGIEMFGEEKITFNHGTYSGRWI